MSGLAFASMSQIYSGMRSSFFTGIRLLAVLAFTVGWARADGSDLTVFAAASLSDAIQELGKNFDRTHGGHVHFNLAGSNALARQIKEGAPADVFFSADEAKMDELARADLIVGDTRQSVLSNSLVVVVNAQHPAAVHTISDLTQSTVGKFALAQTETVPAGIYARKYLTSLGLWTQLQPKVIQCENVRAALAAVSTDNVDAGIVYKTDALISKDVQVAVEIAAQEGPKISYPLAVLKNAPNSKVAHEFADYLESADSRAVFVRYGFTPAMPAKSALP